MKNCKQRNQTKNYKLVSLSNVYDRSTVLILQYDLPMALASQNPLTYVGNTKYLNLNLVSFMIPIK